MTDPLISCTYISQVWLCDHVWNSKTRDLWLLDLLLNMIRSHCKAKLNQSLLVSQYIKESNASWKMTNTTRTRPMSLLLTSNSLICVALPLDGARYYMFAALLHDWLLISDAYLILVKPWIMHDPTSLLKYVLIELNTWFLYAINNSCR